MGAMKPFGFEGAGEDVLGIFGVWVAKTPARGGGRNLRRSRRCSVRPRTSNSDLWIWSESLRIINRPFLGARRAAQENGVEHLRHPVQAQPAASSPVRDACGRVW
jgi:hypothetical protein